MSDRRSVLMLSAFLGFTPVTPRIFAQSSKPRAGVVDIATGAVTVKSSDGTSFPLTVGAFLQEGDTDETGAKSKMHLKFEDGGYLALRSNSSVRIDGHDAKGETVDLASFALLRGALRSVTGWIGKIGGHRTTQKSMNTQKH